jgi:hypothetical protein
MTSDTAGATVDTHVTQDPHPQQPDELPTLQEFQELPSDEPVKHTRRAARGSWPGAVANPRRTRIR